MKRPLADREEQGWQKLFDGVSLNQWMCPYADHGWTVRDGCIELAAPVGNKRNLYTVESYENFILELEFQLEPGVNSGIFLRTVDVADPVNTAIEMQIFDSYGDSELTPKTCGAVYGLVPPAVNACKPAGSWNAVRITCDGPHIFIVLNNVHVARINVAEHTEPGVNPRDGSKTKFRYAWADLPRRGRIGLQDHGGKIRFRNIMIQELS